MNFRFQYVHMFVCALLLSFCGCGNGDVASVEGVVTVDGEPLQGALVAFYPTEGRASMGRTDETGRYQLTYSRNSAGAEIGAHKVTVSTKVDKEVEYGDCDYENEGSDAEITITEVAKAMKETMPLRYRDRRKTELNAIVKSGSNKIDFKLSND